MNAVSLIDMFLSLFDSTLHHPSDTLIVMTNWQKESFETFAKAAARLLRRLDERAKTSGERPERIQEKPAGAADDRAPAEVCPGGHLEANGQDMVDRVLSRCEGRAANDNAHHALDLDESDVTKDRDPDVGTLQGWDE